MPATSPIICADAVSKSFGPVEVLRRVSLEVAEREVICVIGPSGSGKTTLLRCLALLEQPSGGRILMNGTTIGSAAPNAAEKRAARAIRPDIGMVFQHFNLWPHMSVLENGKTDIRLASVGELHPFYSLAGSDNIILLTTERYHERPMVIRGPGAGAEVTAAGVFADVIRIGNYSTT